MNKSAKCFKKISTCVDILYRKKWYIECFKKISTCVDELIENV